MADTVELVVPDEMSGERLDRALATMLQISRSESRRLCDAGVTVDGVESPARTRVASGNVIVTSPPTTAVALAPEEVAFDVILETDAYAVVDKPPGLVVHPGSGNDHGTLASGLLNRYPEIEGVGTPGRWGLIHRLDRDTSGVILVAKTEEAFATLHDELAARKVKRSYTALVSGNLSIPTGTIDAPIGRDATRPTRKAVLAGGKPSITHYTVSQNFPDDDVALLDVRLETGRTHQIRVHLAAIEHPVIGDRVYRSRPTRVDAPRIFLHARALTFTDPSSGQPVTVESPLPTDLRDVLDSLGPPAFP